MNSFDWVSLIAIAEFALLITLVLLVVSTFILRRRSRDRGAATALVDKVKQGESARRGELRKLLLEQLGLAEDEAGATAQRLIDAEKRFYEEFIRTYLSRDDEGVLAMDERLRSVLAPYLSLKRGEAAAAPAGVVAVDGAEESEGLDRGPEVERLKASLRNLSEEMVIYRETLNRVFSEYTAMFGVHLDPAQQLSAKEILDRLNTGELAGGENAEPAADAPADEAAR